ncbi:MAG: hypothetical protein KGI50_08195, partial [Patescibacteria group bacterium]|nr:hypothetical protein [Patescibacteria group bacterium]
MNNDETKDDVLSAISKALKDKRDKAVSARRSSGIEEIWVAAEEAYLSIDEQNRGEYSSDKWEKPQVLGAPLTKKKSNQDDGTRSKMFIPLTRRYVDIAAAKICEIVLPIDDKAFSIDATPIPDMVSDAIAVGRDGLPLSRPATPEEMQQGAPAQVPLTKQEVITKTNEAATAAAKKAESRIYDWMIEANHPAIMRKVIHDAARIGTGVLKAPWPDSKREVATQKTDAGITAVIKESIAPSEYWVDPWNLFPDPTCGSDIKNCDYIFERDVINRFTLSSLKDNPSYLKDQIDKVLKAEEEKKVAGENYSDKKAREGFEIWYFCGTLSREDVSKAVAEDSMATFSGDDVLNVIATMVN